jgi:FMN phosphatase YigB (HAD superfamily)
MGVEKPDVEFFKCLVQKAGCPPDLAVCVGDRVDLDIEPGRAAGLTAVFLRRGPWGYHFSTTGESNCADAQIESLAELSSVLRTLGNRAEGR